MEKKVIQWYGNFLTVWSFYYCIAENCLQDAIKCLENAKGNDSIAYLRFWFRDPRTQDASTHGTTFMIGFALGERTASSRRLYEIVMSSDAGNAD